MAKFQGPVRPTTDEEYFRRTGKSISKFQGPVPEGYDEQYFRRTGRIRPRGTTTTGLSRADREARQLELETQKKQQRQAETQARLEAQRQAQAEQRQREILTKIRNQQELTNADLVELRRQGIQEGAIKRTEFGVEPLKRFAGEKIRRQEGTERLAETIRTTKGSEVIASRPNPLADFLYGETGEKATGIGFFGTPAFISLRDVKTKLQSRGTAGKVAGEFVPTTPLGVAGTVGLAGVYGTLPKVARIGLSGTFTAVGTQQALAKGLSKEQRIVGGIVAGLGATGTLAESLPYLRGATYSRSAGFKPIKTQPRGFKAVEVGGEVSKIGLILEKAPLKSGLTTDIKLPSTSPLKRGGFGVRPSEKSLFIGGPQDVATSQVGLFKEGKSILLEREFFVTPAEPTTKLPEARISRLALSDLTSFTKLKDVKIGFGLPKPSQIGVEKGAFVTRTGKAGTYQIGKGTELEGIKGTGTSITDVKQIGVTTLRGQGIQLYTFRTTPSKDVKISLQSFKQVTTTPTRRISGEATLSTTLGTRSILPLVSAKTTTTKTGTIPSSLPSFSQVSIKTARATGGKTRIFTPEISRRTTPPKTRSPTARLTKTTTTYPVRRQTRTNLFSFFESPRRQISYQPKQRRKESSYVVSVRRFGKFKPVGVTKSLKQALSIGTTKTGETLGATFKVTGKDLKLPTSIPGYYSRSTKQGRLFIERRGRRLSSKSERREIQTAKRRKKKKRSLFDFEF